MSAYCPVCETDLDQATGICPACRWDPVVAASKANTPKSEPLVSLTERYRGTEFESRGFDAAAPVRSGLPRGRLLVLVGFLVMAALYWSVMASMGMLSA